MRTPTTDDFLHREAVDLCTDLAALLLDHRGGIRPEAAYGAAMEGVRAAGHVLEARFGEARTSVLRVLVALDRAGASCPLPTGRVGDLERRLGALARALAGRGGPPAA